MAPKKPLIKTTAIQYCLDHPPPEDDEDKEQVSLAGVCHSQVCLLQGLP